MKYITLIIITIMFRALWTDRGGRRINQWIVFDLGKETISSSSSSTTTTTTTTITLLLQLLLLLSYYYYYY